VRVCVCNRKQAESDLSEVTSARHLISITTPGHELAKIPGSEGGIYTGWDDIVAFQFHDIIPEDLRDLRDAHGKDFVCFDMSMAKKIIEWIDGIPDKREILVHCDAGISRSMAVGRFIAAITPRELTILTPGMSTDQFANVHVWNILRRCWYEREERETRGANAPHNRRTT